VFSNWEGWGGEAFLALPWDSKGIDFETVRMTFGGYKSYCKKFNYSVQYECTNANFEKLACENMVSMGTSS